VIRYEYPLSERVRTYLRLERLYQRFGLLLARDEAIDHHYALVTLFEILDVGSRSDLKGEILKDLERQKQILSGYRGNPAISELMLDQTTAQLEACFSDLSRSNGRPGHVLMENEWLMNLRSRCNIPAGTCEFDLPSYHAWQHRSHKERRQEIAQWIHVLTPLQKAVDLLLRLLRESGLPQQVVAMNGHFQQNQSQTRPALLLRLAMADGSLAWVPEISGHRLMITIRFLHYQSDKRLSSIKENVPFELTLCT
jgi:cell division protein ZapD